MNCREHMQQQALRWWRSPTAGAEARREIAVSCFGQTGYANILLSTDGSNLAKKGVKHGIALAKALNAKATVITVTEPLPVAAYGDGHALGWVPSQEEFDRFDAACKERAGKVLDEARSYGGTDRDICRTLACSECAPSHCDSRNGKVQRLRLNHHGLSWASRPQEVIFGESNIGGPSGRKRAGVGSVVAVFSLGR